MSRPPRPLRFLCSALLGLAAVLGEGACVGTPLPEPPDAFPRPDLAEPEGDLGPASYPIMPTAVIRLRASTVPATANVTVLNLDTAAVGQSRDASVNAATTLVLGVLASPGDRLRVLFTSDRAHSPPLDLVAEMPLVAGGNELPTRLLGDTSLPCLRIMPAETLVLSGSGGLINVTNMCGVPVALTRAALRTGAAGVQLAAPPTAQLAAGASLELTLQDSQGPGPFERHDVLLLDVSADDGRMGRYAIDVFSDLQ